VKRYGYSKAAWEDLWKRKTAKWGDAGVNSLDIEITPEDDMDIDLLFNWLHRDQITDILYKLHADDDMDEGGPDHNLDDQIYNYMKNNFIGAAHEILDGPVEAIFGVKPESGLETGEISLNDFQSDYITIQVTIPRGLQRISTAGGWENINTHVNVRFDQMIRLYDAILGPNANWEGF
jgi:hypothetical protein